MNDSWIGPVRISEHITSQVTVTWNWLMEASASMALMLNTPMSKIHLILNRANSKVKLEVSEVERTLQVKADALIPSDIVVPQSVNKGTPVVLDAPRSSIAKSLEQLADRFAPAEAGTSKKRSWR